MSEAEYSDLTVDWTDAGSIEPNDYNPNHMSRKKKRELKKSILDNGWTQPIVVNVETGQIIDGEQRWSLVAPESDDRDDEIAENESLTPDGHPAGHVPVVRISKDEAEARVATVQHNRARGEHTLEGMSDLLADLHDFESLDLARDRLMMDDEEVDRLLQQSPAVEMGTDDTSDFSPMWEPDEEGAEEAEGSDDVSATEAAADTLGDDDENPADDGSGDSQGGATTENLERRVYVMNESEAELVDEVLGTEVPAQVLVTLCQHAKSEGWVPPQAEDVAEEAD